MGLGGNTLVMGGVTSMGGGVKVGKGLVKPEPRSAPMLLRAIFERQGSNHQTSCPTNFPILTILCSNASASTAQVVGASWPQRR